MPIRDSPSLPLDLSSLARELDALGDDDLLVNWLIRTTRDLSRSEESLRECARIISARQESERFRCILVVILGLGATSAGTDEFLETLAKTEHDALATIALRVLLLRRTYRTAEPASDAWLSHFWRGAFNYPPFGETLNPGYVERMRGTTLPLQSGQRVPLESLTPWAYAHLSPSDDSTAHVLSILVLNAQSNAVRFSALMELPANPNTDETIAAILADQRAPSDLRVAGYQKLAPGRTNWKTLEDGLRRERDPHVLSVLAACVFKSMGKEDQPTAVQELEQVGLEFGDDEELASQVVNSLSLCDCPAAIVALVRLARNSHSAALRVAAVQAINAPADSSQVEKERSDALQSLSVDVDPTLSAAACLERLRCALTNRKMGKPDPKSEDDIIRRIQDLQAMPSIPDDLRSSLEAGVRMLNRERETQR